MHPNHRFLKACRREPVDTTPIWLMRQAGRYMPEYRTLRKKYSILDMIKTPDLATEVTLQPIRAFDLDAAIIFADILTLPEAMGLHLEFVPDGGPVFHTRIKRSEDINQLPIIDPEDALRFTMDAIRQVSHELNRTIPLIGFSGAPFTLACYIIEGGSSKTFAKTQTFMRKHPKAWHDLMTKLTVNVGAYLGAQIHAGVQAAQLFDSWAGILNHDDYQEFVFPYSRKVVQQVQEHHVPVIHFSARSRDILTCIAELNPDVISINADMKISTTWDTVGRGFAIQGNLDPYILAEKEIDTIHREGARILDDVKGRPGHIFNLGHGVLKHTPPENVTALVKFVHETGNHSH